MKIELVVDGKITAECTEETQFLAFHAAIYSALSDMQLTLQNERRARAESKMNLLNELVFKTDSKGRN